MKSYIGGGDGIYRSPSERKQIWTSSVLNISFKELFYLYTPMESRDSSVGIVLGYGLDDRGSEVPFPAGAGNFSLHHRFQTALEPTQPPNQRVPARGCFPVGQADGAWNWPLTYI
jgi:hypothetical protein